MTKINQLLMEMISYYKNDPKRIQHFMKVYQFAKMIGQMEHLPKEEQEILEIAAIVHDIGIRISEEKYGNSNGKHQEEEGAALAERLLNKLQMEQEIIQRVSYLVAHHHTYTDIKGNDYQILVEADFLVNLYEEGVCKDATKTTYERIFKTNTGKEICNKMYGLGI